MLGNCRGFFILLGISGLSLASQANSWSQNFLIPSLASCFRIYLDPIRSHYEWALNENDCTPQFVEQELKNWAHEDYQKEIANYLILKTHALDAKNGIFEWVDNELLKLESSWIASERMLALLEILWENKANDRVYSILRDSKYQKIVQSLSLSDLGRFVETHFEDKKLSSYQKEFYERYLTRLESDVSFDKWSGGESEKTLSKVESIFAIRKLIKKKIPKEWERKVSISFTAPEANIPPPPPQSQWTFEEHTFYIKALMRDVQSEKALKHVESLMQKMKSRYPEVNVTNKDFWNFFFLHTRLLRILDRREEIASVISDYRKRFDIDKIVRDKKAPLWMQEQFFQLTKLFWNQDLLEETEESLEVLKDSPYPIVQAKRLHTLARMLEQKIPLWNSELRSRFDAALANVSLPQDLRMDLLWRRVYLLFDFEKQKELIQALEDLRPFVQKEPSERARFFFWMGEAFTVSKLSEEAKRAYEWAYQEDPFSFYSVFSALKLMSLGNVVPDWLPKSHEQKIAPYPYGSNIYLDRGRVLEMLGQIPSAQQALRQGEKSFWAFMFSKKNNLDEKRMLFYAFSDAYIKAQEPQGSLRLAEAFRQAVGSSFASEDLQRLYPQPYEAVIKKEATEQGVNPWLSTSLIRQESAFDANAKSIANALGLMQMIPPVAQLEARRLGLKSFENTQLYEPSIALKLGHFHLKGLLASFEQCWICSIAAYNAGSPPVKRWLERSYRSSASPFLFIERISYQETRTYVRNILRNFINYQRSQKNGKIDLNEILLLPPGLPGGSI